MQCTVMTSRQARLILDTNIIFEVAPGAIYEMSLSLEISPGAIHAILRYSYEIAPRAF